MPLDQFVAINKTQAYAIWYIQESEAALLNQLHTNSADIAGYSEFLDPIKRIEWLAARLAYQVLCQEMSIPCVSIQKDLYGRPYLGHGHAYISLSHCYPFAGAIVSKHIPIGLDIEMPRLKLLAIQSKYLTPAEIADSNQDVEKLCIYWSAKEAIYKAYTHAHYPSLSFIQMEPFIRSLQGKLRGNTVSGHRYFVHYKKLTDHVLTWCEEEL